MNNLKLDFLCNYNHFFEGDGEIRYVLDLQMFINACFKDKRIDQICFTKEDYQELHCDLKYRDDMVLQSDDILNADYVVVIAKRRLDAHSVQLCLLLFPDVKTKGICIGWTELTATKLGEQMAESLRKSTKSIKIFYPTSKDNVQVAKKIIAYRRNRGRGRTNMQDSLFTILCEFGAQADLRAPLDGLSTITRSKGKSTLAMAYLDEAGGIGCGPLTENGTVQTDKSKSCRICFALNFVLLFSNDLLTICL
jgi:hypothetical protein